MQGKGPDLGGLSHPVAGARENRTGMPVDLLIGLEQLSGVDLSGVRVHYHSPEPARVDALAYTHGQDIVLGPGQERHLPHEGWHVVQQMQGRVRPTLQSKGLLINDEEVFEREADLMGSKAMVLGKQAKTPGFHASFASADGTALNDEPYVAGVGTIFQRVASRVAETRIGGSIVPVIQRATSFVAGSVSSTINQASHLIGGGRDAGFTPPTLNGSTILSAAAAQSAIRAPTLGGRSKLDGTEETWVNAVGTNEGSFTMRLPSAGPWSTVTAKANVASLLSSLNLTAQPQCGSTAGDSTFSVHGKPTDAGFVANVRTHENLHAADHRTGFNAVIVPWDTRLEAAKTAGTRFSGATLADAEAALFTAMGGTSAQIATAQHNRWLSLNNATHLGTTLATGGPATPSNPVADATCSTSSIDAT